MGVLMFGPASGPSEEQALAFLRINDAVPNSIVYEFMERLNAKLEHDSRPIRFYGPGANPQRSRYFLVALA